MRFYPLPLRAFFGRNAPLAFPSASPLVSPLPWRPSCAYHVLSRLQPHGVSAEETQQLICAATVHGALAIDTVQGLIVPDRIPLLTFQDLEGMSLLFMEWNRFTPECSIHLVRSIVNSANAHAATELLLLRDPWTRLIIRIRSRPDL